MTAGGAWPSARLGLTLLAWTAVTASLATGAFAIWGAESERIGWSLALHRLLGVATPVLAAVALAAGLGALASSAVASDRAMVGAAAGGALAAGLLLVAFGAWRAQVAHAELVEPPVHDVATDWREPLMPTPALRRRRGPRALPIEAAPAVSEGPRGALLGRLVAEVNATTCPRAQPLTLAQPTSAAYDRLKAAVIGAGLRLVTDDPAAGVLEAEAPAPLAWGAHADVMARVRRQGAGARVDLRSVSRHGRVDGGTNCRRVTALREALAG